MMEEQNSPAVFCEWLKQRRKALDLTQPELAQRAGCSVGALRKIEAGERRPSKQLAALLARALEIPDQDQAVFIRVARGELNLERLQPPRQPPQPAPAGATAVRELQTAALPVRIPLPTTPLIGREAELAALEKLFKNPQCRLLTLTGIGGIGKTRLALEFAARAQPAFPGGVYYISLASVNSPEKTVPAIADVLGFGFSGPGDPKEQLLAHLSACIRGEALFILDNLEHLLAPWAPGEGRFGVVELVTETLQLLPQAKILGTSRERLNLHGEWTYELHGLSLPPAGYVQPLEEYDAIALFMKSARRIRSDFSAGADEQPALLQIVQQVDGVPLAIELAAAWVSVLSCPEIAREISASLDFLTTTMRDLPERHRSIRATFDHSWTLLPEDERRALCQLAVFHGGFEREAARQVAGADLPQLASLSDKSLVRRSESGRFDLHEVIRQYALAHLKQHSLYPETCARHCAYYLGLAREHECQLKSGAQQQAIQRLTGEIDNLRAAWAWAIEHQQFDLLGQAGRGFGWYFEITGLYREGIEQFTQLAQAIQTGPQEVPRGRLLGLAQIHQALLYFRKGEFGQAQGLYESAIQNLRSTGDCALLADALGFLGTVLHLQGEYERARLLLEESYILARQSHERWFEAWAVFNLGHIDGLIGFYGHGYEQMQAGIALWRAIGDPQSIALGLNFLVPTLINLGRFEEAKTYMHESIALCEQSKNRWGMGTAYRFLGLACTAAGQFGEAQAHLLKSLEIFGGFAQGWDIARSLSYLGDASRLAGNYPEARQFYRDALQHAVDSNGIPIALDALWGLGEIQAQAGEAAEALALCYSIVGHPACEEDTKLRAARLSQALEAKLDPAQVEAARGAAREKAFAGVVSEALKGV